MTQKQTLLIPAILLVLGIVAFIALKSQRSGGASEDTVNEEQTNAPNSPQQSDHRLPSQIKRERKGEADAKAFRELEIEFDKILPAQFPQQSSSLCDATLKPGETLILGGFERSDGNYEFTQLEVEPLKMDGTPFKPGEMDSAPLQYRILTKSLAISREASSKIGLGSLLSPAKTRIQKNLIFTSAEVMLLMGVDTVRADTKPTITAKADTSAVLSIGTIETEKPGHAISMMVSPIEGGESTRIRVRVEGTQGNLP